MRIETIFIVVGKLRAGVGWHCLQWWWSLRTASASPFTYRRAQFKYRKRYLFLGKRLFCRLRFRCSLYYDKVHAAQATNSNFWKVFSL